MTADMTTPPPEIARDQYGRPMVIPPNGGKPVPYTRCTTYVDGIEDKTALSKWAQRMVALGLVDNPHLQLAVAAHRGNKFKLNDICYEAKEAARASAGATTGTALHSLTEQLDRGIELGAVPEAYRADLAAYTLGTAQLRATAIEQFCVLDTLRIGGTPDRVVKYQGKTYIADLKTGDLEYSYVKIAAQLAVYARSATYDIATGARGQHGADLHRGIVIHLPAGQGVCTLYWVDLMAGWDAVRVCRSIREHRAAKYGDILTPLSDPPPTAAVWGDIPLVPLTPGEVLVTRPSTPSGPQDAPYPAELAPRENLENSLTGKGIEPSPDSTETLTRRIRGCTTADEVRQLWSNHAAYWTAELTTVAKQHIASLTNA